MNVFVAFYVLFLFSTCANAYVSFNSNWGGTRRWFGPEWWANPMQDWGLKDGVAKAPAALHRTLCLLPFTPGANGPASFDMRVTVNIDRVNGFDRNLEQFGLGFRFGRRARINDYRAALVHATEWIDAVVRGDGKVAIIDTVSTEAFDFSAGPINLHLVAIYDGAYVKVDLNAEQYGKVISVQRWFLLDEIKGGICLLSNGPGNPGQVYSSFENFNIEGNLLETYWERNFGPLLWTQYTLNNNQLKLQAQLAMVEQPIPVQLWIEDDNFVFQWRGETAMDEFSCTALFDMPYYEGHTNRRYEVRVTMFGTEFKWGGYIRAEPKEMDNLKIACFSCDHGYAFPLDTMVEQVTAQNPDVMYFAGDQIYEIYGGFGDARTAPTHWAMMDFLRKYYQFGLTWRSLLADRPSVIIPDDHDVFMGNLFGNGGTAMKNEHPYAWPDGGYIMSGEWVRAVEKIHVGSLPNPAVDMTLPIGIKPYFTSMTYGGVGFAILEDRKFKTAPNSLEDWQQKFGDGANLLGPEQEAFLADWAQNWEGQQMKIALSQTIFAKATTHETPELKRIYYNHDSGGWPRDARNRAVQIMGDNNVLGLHGDQHLGLLLRHGINEFNDAGYGFMVPGTANGWPRAWWPGHTSGDVPEEDKCFLGQYTDDAGHPISVLAVANPGHGSNHLKPEETLDPYEIAYRKGSGYGLVELNKYDKTATINLYRTGRWNEQFDTFPKTIYLGGQHDRNSRSHTNVQFPDGTCKRKNFF